jgi:hypothetical protein
MIFSPHANQSISCHALDLCENKNMARGWESKDVESQVTAVEEKPSNFGAGPQSDEKVRQQQIRKDLELSRTRVLRDLESATHPNHRKSLEAALAHLDQKLSELN